MKTNPNLITNARALALISAAEREIDRLHDWAKAESQHLTDTDLDLLRLHWVKLSELRLSLHLDVAVYDLPANPEQFWALFDLLHLTAKVGA